MKKNDPSKVNYLNVGCGNRFHPAWVNVDIASHHREVISYNILKGIPFPDNTFDLVYHSHVLEHFQKESGRHFIMECFRVLRSGGIIRIAVPDLERIARTYLDKMESSLKGDEKAAADYDWILLELYDQTIRNESGGEMKNFIARDQIPNEAFVYERIGAEARDLRNSLIKYKTRNDWKKQVKEGLTLIKRLFNFIPFIKYYRIGKFRNRGEIHYWMYDRYSLANLLLKCGFADIKVQTATGSLVSDWERFELDEKNGVPHKPDSLYMEAVKP